jgi:hypothetical protein
MIEILLQILLSGTLLTLAGCAAERALRDIGHPQRVVWAVTMSAMALTTILLLAGGSLPLRVPGAVTELVALAGTDGPRTTSSATTRSVPGAVLGGAWVGLTSVLLLGLAVCGTLQQRRLGRGTKDCLYGVDVTVTDHLGPAVAGVLWPSIVIPKWLGELPAEHQRVIVRHEAEHAAAGDHRLAAGALVLCCLIPWNPLLWYQLRRLRVAIEIDCDARVLGRQAPGRVAYGLLLIDVAERMARGTPLATPLVHPRGALERRLRMLNRRTVRPLRAVVSAVIAGALIAAACADPTQPEAASQNPKVSAAVFHATAGTLTRRTAEPAQATYTPRDRVPGGERQTSLSGNRLVRFEVQIGPDGHATNVRFAPGTTKELQTVARPAIESSQFRRSADHQAEDWIPAIMALP